MNILWRYTADCVTCSGSFRDHDLRIFKFLLETIRSKKNKYHNVANITNEALSDSEADGDVMDKVTSSGYPSDVDY